MKFSYDIQFSEKKSKEQFYIYIEIVGKWNFCFIGKSETDGKWNFCFIGKYETEKLIFLFRLDQKSQKETPGKKHRKHFVI